MSEAALGQRHTSKVVVQALWISVLARESELLKLLLSPVYQGYTQV